MALPAPPEAPLPEVSLLAPGRAPFVNIYPWHQDSLSIPYLGGRRGPEASWFLPERPAVPAAHSAGDLWRRIRVLEGHWCLTFLTHSAIGALAPWKAARCTETRRPGLDRRSC